MARRAEHRAPSEARWLRRLAALAVAAAGVALLIFAQSWRGLEATLAAASIHGITGQQTVANPTQHLLILYKSTSVQSVFVLTSECSVAYLLATLLIGSAPLMLLKKLPLHRTAAAIGIAALILVVVNTARLTAIGATVSEWGRDPGLTIAHTYLGSVLTVVGTAAAGLAFAAVLVGWRRPRRSLG